MRGNCGADRQDFYKTNISLKGQKDLGELKKACLDAAGFSFYNSFSRYSAEYI